MTANVELQKTGLDPIPIQMIDVKLLLKNTLSQRERSRTSKNWGKGPVTYIRDRLKIRERIVVNGKLMYTSDSNTAMTKFVNIRAMAKAGGVCTFKWRAISYTVGVLEIALSDDGTGTEIMISSESQPKYIPIRLTLVVGQQK